MARPKKNIKDKLANGTLRRDREPDAFDKNGVVKAAVRAGTAIKKHPASKLPITPPLLVDWGKTEWLRIVKKLSANGNWHDGLYSVVEKICMEEDRLGYAYRDEIKDRGLKIPTNYAAFGLPPPNTRINNCIANIKNLWSQIALKDLLAGAEVATEKSAEQIKLESVFG